MGDYVIDLFDVFGIIRKRILIVIISVLVFVAVSVVKSFLTPATYRSEATMALPTTANSFLLKRLDENTQSLVNDYIINVINVAETRELLHGLSDDGYKALQPYVIDATMLADSIEIRVDDIWGTDRYFRIIVKARNHPGSAADIIWGLAGYLNSHPLLIGKVSKDKNSQSYLFIRKPSVNTTPISPKPLMNGVLMGLVGFLSGCLIALAYQMLTKGKRDFAAK